jgi:NTE family protein
MKKCTAFVLSGGGSRGALQVGALRALLQAGYVPDLLVGTSIGAANATALAMWGVNLEGLAALEQVWNQIANAEMLDRRISQLILRVMMGHPSDRTHKKVANYFMSLGISPNLTFEMVPFAHLALISADLESAIPVIYGQNQDDSVLEGLLTSIAVPPWFMPIQKDGQIIMDGGALSVLPIEPAIRMGATEIIALDLGDPTMYPKENLTVPQYFSKYLFAASRRHIQLEMQIASMQGIPVHRMDFHGLAKTPMWDFRDYQALRQAGYEKAQQMIAEWHKEALCDAVTTPHATHQVR